MAEPAKRINRTKIMTDLLWRFGERSGAQLVAFAVSVLLARLLDPEVYGVVALVTVFTAILQVFVDSGLGNALIQKRDADELDFSTVFFTNLLLCTVLYALMFLAAPGIAKFYGDPEMTGYIRVLSLTVLISGVKNVQQAYVSRNMLFKRFFFSTLGGTVVSGVVGVVLALRGFGVWALVAQHVVNLAVDTLILWCTVGWRPRKQFSMDRLRGLFRFGSKLLASSLLDRGYQQLRSLLIGKLYTSADLAFFNQGQRMPHLVVTNINASMDSVLLPVLSTVQDRQAQIRSMTRRAMKTSTYLMAPVMLGLAAVSEPLIRLVFTEKWLPCVPFFRVFCVTYLFYPLHTANLNAVKAMGRSDLFLKLELMKRGVGLTLLLLTLPISVEAMVYSLLLTSVSSQIINSWPNRELLDYGYWDQLKDILPSIMLAVAMGLLVSAFSLLKLSDPVTLLIQTAAGAVIYVGGSAVLHLESFEYLLEAVGLRRRR